MYGFFKALPFLGKRRCIFPPPESKEDTSHSQREPEACLKPRLQRIVKPLPQFQGMPHFEVICKPQVSSWEQRSEKQESAQEQVATQETNGDVRAEIEKLKKELQDQSRKRQEESEQRRNKSKGLKEDKDAHSPTL